MANLQESIIIFHQILSMAFCDQIGRYTLLKQSDELRAAANELAFGCEAY